MSLKRDSHLLNIHFVAKSHPPKAIIPVRIKLRAGNLTFNI